MNTDIIVNLSRIGKKGTGLSVFSKDVIKALRSYFDVAIVASDPGYFDGDIKVFHVPDWISMTQTISKVRPVLWLIYSMFFFPGRHGRILSTTHHPVPGVKKQIISLLDMRPYFYPDSIVQRIFFRFILPRAIRKVDGVITISETSRRLIVDHYSIDKAKVHVVPLYVDGSIFYSQHDVNPAKPPYLLMVGANWSHKNAHELIENSEIWADKFRLKIISGNTQYKKRLDDLALKSGIRDRIDFIDYAGQEELVSLYQRATALVYPSLMEGFGIPPLEAMHCGIPVIVSDIEVFREIYGDTPIYVKLGRKSSWEEAFALLDNKQSISKKIQQGFLKSREYSEERMRSALINAVLSIWPDLRSSGDFR